MTAVLTLALAISANTIILSVLKALVLHPLNLPHPRTCTCCNDFGAIGPSLALYPDCLNLRGQSRSFESLVSYDIVGGVGLDRRGSPSVVWLYMVSGNYFDSLDVQPYLGRFIHSSDERG